MKTNAKLEDINIRTELKPGDIGYVIHLHGSLYKKEYNYGIQLEAYVAEGLCEFYRNYDPLKDRVWVCEHNDKIIGFLLLMHRCESAQLRYFLIHPDYRNIGLGAKLMKLYMEFLTLCNYKHTFLWTTNEQTKASSIYKKIGFKLTEEKESTNFGKPLIEQRYDFMIN